ncbi:hypothetical protein Tco_0819640 [Tanacetum coccineum]|uniref:Uncharacterized protein n=1 Tax=Tanacetum coccineum TaxID=301880 RepID=A0ABQ5ABI9_9ASTR
MVAIKEFAKPPVNIDLMPVGPSSFDVINSIDQLSKYHVVIIRDEEIVPVPHGDETLIIQELNALRTPESFVTHANFDTPGGKVVGSKHRLCMCHITQKLPTKNKVDNLEHLVGVAKSPVVNVNNPSVGTPKVHRKLRIKGGKEKAIEKTLKNMNACSLCGSFDHNKRRCPKRFEDQDQVVVQH